jgi:Uma2 family endonuclease
MMTVESPLNEGPGDDGMAELARRHPYVQFRRDPSGRLLASPVTEGEAGRRVALLCLHLAIWHGKYRTGEIFDGSTGFRLPDGSLCFPDAAWVARGSWNGLSRAERDGFVPLCPDVVFKLSSPDSPQEEEVQTYLRNGAALTAFIDIERRVVELHRPRGIERSSNPREVNIVELSYFTVEAAKLFG